MKRTFGRSARWLILAMAFVLIGYFATEWAINVREKAMLARITDRVLILTKVLQEYVDDHGSFPTSLEAMIKERNLDERLLQSIFDERTEYFRPGDNQHDSDEVIVVTLGTNRIAVNKKFERTP